MLGSLWCVGQSATCQPGWYDIVDDPTVIGNIQWCQVPAPFSLHPRFKVVFGAGPSQTSTYTTSTCDGSTYDFNEPLEYGYSHMNIGMNPASSSYQGLQPSQRAHIQGMFRNVSNASSYPLNTDHSPFCNDISTLTNEWDDILYLDQEPEFDLFVWDVEKALNGDAGIATKMADLVATGCNELRSTPTTNYVSSYKQGMSQMYNLPIRHLKQRLSATDITFSSYADVPIHRQWWQIPYENWADWTGTFKPDDNRGYNYLTRNSNCEDWSNFYHNLDFFTPSAYYFYSYNTGAAKDYLAYLLFQVEANNAWADPDGPGGVDKKPVIPFIWMRFHPSGNAPLDFIHPWMAEASAIFPLVSGADGIWQWGSIAYFDQNTSLAAHDYFNRGLYRVSQFNDIFNGDISYTDEVNSNIENPVDLYSNNSPVWRGVISEDKGKILVAAHNPYAKENDLTTMEVSYSEGACQWSETIHLKGREIFLQSFILCPKVLNPNLASNNMELWLKGGDAKNFEELANSFTWLDASGNNRDAFQTNPARFPTILANETLYFDYTSTTNNDELVITNPPVFTPNDNWQVFFVAKAEETHWQQVLNYGSGHKWGMYAAHGSRPFLYTHNVSTGANDWHFAGNAINQKAHVYSLKRSGSVYTWYVDGVVNKVENKGANDVTLNTGNVWVIADHYSKSIKGEISEILVYGRTLAEEEQTEVSSYLCNKFDVANCLCDTEESIAQYGVFAAPKMEMEQLPNSLEVFPNPASENISISWGDSNKQQGAVFEIFNAVGKKMLEQPLENQTTMVNVKGWDAGVYFIKLQGAEQVKRVVIAR